MIVLRPTWDEIFMEQARLMARRSTCLRRQVGAVLVRDKRAIASGYNGPPSSLLHCAERGGCLRAQLNVPPGERQEICRALHAEQNVVLQLAITGLSGVNSTIYVTHFPCFTCAKLLVQLGVREVVYAEGYPDQFSRDVLEEARVVCRPFPGSGGTLTGEA
ncbi:MAG: dCMP deaminase family protein [Bacillota bacterium]